MLMVGADINQIYKEYKKLFSTTIILDHIKNRKKSYLNNFKNPEKNLTNKLLYEEIYVKLFDNYRFEYIFKNEIINYFLEDILSNNTKILIELKLYESDMLVNIVDMVIINNDNIFAIEIKSDVDSTQRLYNQLTTYSKIFKYVSVFISEERLEEFVEYLNATELQNIGIIVLTRKNIKYIKLPKENSLSANTLIENIKFYNPMVDIPDNSSIEYIYSMWVDTLNLIYTLSRVDIAFFSKMPRSLKLFSYTHGFIKKLKKSLLVNFFKS